MCETASIVATPRPTVAKKAKGIAGLALPKMRLYFQINEKGWGSHHSPILEAAHLKTTNYVSLVVVDGNPAKGIKYETILPTWYLNAQAEYEAQVKKLVTKVNKLLPAAQKKCTVAKSVYDKELAHIGKDKKMTDHAKQVAKNAAEKKFQTALKGAFATIRKIPGFVA